MRNFRRRKVNLLTKEEKHFLDYLSEMTRRCAKLTEREIRRINGLPYEEIE